MTDTKPVNRSKQRRTDRSRRAEDDRASGRRKLWTEVLAVAAGVLGVATVVLGWFAVDRAQVVNNNQQTINNNEALIEELRSQVEELEGEVAEKDEEIAALEASGGPSDTGDDGDSTPTPPESEPGIYHEGDVTVVEQGREVYIWSPRDDEKWETNTAGNGRIWVNDAGNLALLNVEILDLRGEPATWDACSGSTAYDPNFDSTTIQVGETVCVTDGSDPAQYGAITFKARDGNRVTVHVKTWEWE